MPHDGIGTSGFEDLFQFLITLVSFIFYTIKVQMLLNFFKISKGFMFQMLPQFYHAVTQDNPWSLRNEFSVKFEFPTLINLIWHFGLYVAND